MLTRMKSPKSLPHLIHLLIAPGFEETFVAACLVRLREAGMGIALVGVTRGEIVGAHGVGMCPDLALEEAERQVVPRMLIVPGGAQCTRAFAIDPRFYRILVNVMEAGTVVLVGEAKSLLQAEQARVLALHPERILSQGEMDEGDFLEHLVRFVMGGAFLQKRAEELTKD